MENLIAILIPVVGTIVSTITGTEIFKAIFPKAGSRVVTYIVWAIVAFVAIWVMELLPSWLVVVLLLASSGLYSAILKPPLDWVKNRFRTMGDPPVGGGGSGPFPDGGG